MRLWAKDSWTMISRFWTLFLISKLSSRCHWNCRKNVWILRFICGWDYTIAFRKRMWIAPVFSSCNVNTMWKGEDSH
jgi:hypothetical protein